jgi:hypothetical protein
MKAHRRTLEEDEADVSNTNAADDWLRLDNAAKIYPASHTDATPAVFRISVTLKEPIRIRELQMALDRMIRRAPYYQVHLRKGFFWFYLERHSDPIRVRRMPDGPIASIDILRRHEQLFRISAQGGTIAADFAHVLTDGYGAMRFLSSLIVDYLRLLGARLEPGSLLMDPEEPVPEEEYEDAYQKIYRPDVPKEPDHEPAYHIGGVPLLHGYRVITGRMPVAQALATAKRYGGTLTEYFVAVYMHAIRAIYERQAAGVFKPRHTIVRVEVPANVRKLAPSQTMRNFSLYASPEIDLRTDEWAFDAIVRRVHHQMNIQLNLGELARQVARNVGGERNTFTRILPRVVKYAYLQHISRTVGDRSYSAVISNLGRFILPDAAAPYVSGVGFALGPNASYKTCSAVVSYGDELSVSFGSAIENRAVERGFFRKLVEDGIEVTVSEQGP